MSLVLQNTKALNEVYRHPHRDRNPQGYELRCKISFFGVFGFCNEKNNNKILEFHTAPQENAHLGWPQ